MKNLKLIAAFAVAAIMIVSVVAIAYSAPESEASDPVQSDFNINALMALPDYLSHQHTPESVSMDSSDSPAPNQILFLKDNYTVLAGQTITIGGTSAIAFCPLQPFSMASTNATFVFEEGAKILIVNDEVSSLSELGLNDKIIDQFTVGDDEEYQFNLNGTVRNAVGDTGLMNFELTALKGTVINCNHSEESKADPPVTVTFLEDTKAYVSVASFNLSTPSVDLKIGASINAKLASGPTYATVTGSPEYTAKVSFASATDTMTATVTGTGSVTALLKYIDGSTEKDAGTVTYTNAIDFTVTVNDYSSTTTDPTANLKGEFRVDTTMTDVDLEMYGDDTKLDAVLEIRDIGEHFRVTFDDSRFNISGSVDVGNITYRDAVADLEMFQLKGASVGFEFGAKVDLASDATAAFSLGLGAPAVLSPSPPSVPEQYLAELAEHPEMDVDEFAADFFFDKYAPQLTDLDDKHFTANLDVDRIFLRDQFEATGVYANLEVSNSVGMSASAGIGSLTLTQSPVKLPMTPSGAYTKVEARNASVDVHTSDSRTVFLEVEATATGELKSYNKTTGFLVSDIYFNGASVSATIADETVPESLSVDSFGYGQYGVFMTGSKVSYDPDKEQVTIGTISIEGDCYDPSAPLVSRVEGEIRGVTMSTSSSSSSSSQKIDSVYVRVYDLDGDYVDYNRSFDSKMNAINNSFDFDGVVRMSDVMPILEDYMEMRVGKSTKTSAEVYTVSGTGIFAGPSVPLTTGVTITKGVVTISGLDMYGRLTGPISVGNDAPTSGTSRVVVDGKTINATLTGAALTMIVNDDKTVSYRITAMPGYKFAPQGSYYGFSVTESNDDYAVITLNAGDNLDISYIAEKRPFKVSVDGETKVSDAKLGETVKFATTADYLFDERGAWVGSIADGEWSNTFYRWVGDVELTSVTMSEFNKWTKGADDKYLLDYTSEKDSVYFTTPADLPADSNLSFTMQSKVRFAFVPAADSKYNLIAQPTTYKGNDGFIIKASDALGVSIPTTLYIPVSGEGQKVMHVDQYGRAAEQASTYVVIDGQGYQAVQATGYSIFYTESDSPLFDDGGNGKNNNLLYIGIAVVIAVVALAGVAYFLKTKQGA